MGTTRQLLEEAGFTVTPASGAGTHGTCPAETGFPFVKYHPQDSFTPRFRDVYVSGMTHGREKDGTRVDFCYVTSSVHGVSHRHKPVRGWYEPDESSCANIFASGRDEEEAVTAFIEKFKRLEYNTSGKR